MTTKLHLKNVGKFKNATFELTDKGIQLIKGKNGDGKTTICRAIDFALFGRGDTTALKSIGSKGAGSVTLEIQGIKIHRPLIKIGKNGSKTNKLIVNDTIEGNAAQAYINQLFPEDFTNSFHLQQDEGNFLDEKPTTQNKVLKEIVFNRCNPDDIKKGIENDMKVLERQFLEKDTQLAEKRGYLSQLQIPEEVCIDETLQDITIEEQRKRIQTLQNQQIQFETSLKEQQNLENEMKVHQQLENHLMEESLVEMKKIENINEEELESTIQRMKQFRRKGEINKEIAQNQKLYDEMVENEMKTSRKKLEKVKERKDILEFSAEECKTQSNEIRQTISLFREYEKLEQEYESIPEYDEEIEKTYNEANENLSKCVKILDGLKDYHNCKCCDPPVPHIILNDEMEIYSNKLITSKGIETPFGIKNKRELTGIIRTEKKNVDKYKKQMDDNNTNEARAVAIEKKMKKLEKQLKGKIEEKERKKLENIQDIYDKHIKYDQLIQKYTQDINEVESKFSKIQSRINKLTREYKAMDKDDDIEYDEAELERCEQELLQIKTSRNTIRRINDKLLDERNHFIRIEKELASIRELLTNIPPDLGETIIQYQQQLILIERYQTFKNLKKMYDGYQEEIRNLQSEIGEITKKQKLNSEFKGIIKEAEHISIDKILKHFNGVVQSHIDNIFIEEPMIFEMFFKGNNRTGGDGYSIGTRIFYKGNEYPKISMLSGGEKDKLRLIFALVFATINSSPLVILDESTRSIDLNATEDILNYMKIRYPDKLIIVVSHQPVEGLFDHVLELKSK